MSWSPVPWATGIGLDDFDFWTKSVPLGPVLREADRPGESRTYYISSASS